MPDDPRHAQEGLPPLPPGALFVGRETDKVGESPTRAVVALPAGNDDDVLTVVEGEPAWAAPSAPSGGSSVDLTALEGAAADALIAVKETGDASIRWGQHADGTQHWSTPGDASAGGSFGWNDDNYGWVLQGQPGTGDTELYIVNPDDPTQYLNIYIGGTGPVISFQSAHDGFALSIGDDGASVRLAVSLIDLPVQGSGVKLRSLDGTQTKTLRLSNAGAIELV